MSDEREPPPLRGFELNRRQVLTGIPAVAGAGALAGCVTPNWNATDEATGQPTIDFFVRRREDQLELRFTFWNARLSGRFLGPLALKRLRPADPMIVRIEFPAQHVLERAFREEAGNPDPLEGPPVDAMLSQKTRLVFEVDFSARRSLPLTLPRLLDWSSWTSRIVPEVRPIAAVAPPDRLQTSIELPARLVLSPGSSDRWVTPRTIPSGDGERFELWHARLAAGDSAQLPTVRAVWTPDFVNPAPTTCLPSSLAPIHRQHLVRVTHTSEHRADPISPDALLLTSMGGWLRLKKAFDRTIPENRGYIKAWEHRVAGGRDEFVQVEYAAVLYPFGFHVSVVTTTERKIETPRGQQPTGYLRRRVQIKFEELQRSYGAWDMPFASVEPAELITPPLDDPEDFINGPPFEDGAFWAKVNRSPYEFPLIATDHDGARIAFTAPMICIMEVERDPPALLRAAMREYDAATVNLRERSFGGAAVAVAPSSAEGRTAVGVALIRFNGRLMHQGAEREEIPWRGFEPVAQGIKASLNAATSNGAIPPGTATWFAPYDPEQSGNANEVFLVAAAGDAASVTFGERTSESGGILSPRFAIGGVSRISGPFGSSGQALRGGSAFANGRFDPLEFFGGDAKLFGGISLGDIFEEVAGVAGIKAPAMLSLLEQYTDDLPYWQHSFRWQTDQLRSSPPLGPLKPVLLVAADNDASMPTPGSPTVLSARGTAIVPIFDPAAASIEFEATLHNFCIQLVAFGEGVRLKVQSCSFSASSGSKSRFDIDIVDYELVGTIMSFVKMLQDFLPGFGENKPIDVSPKGVTISLPSVNLPPIVLGAFNLENIRILSGAYLPFDGSPLELSFALSSAEDPFMVTVGVFGGGGHIKLVLDAEGVKSIEASLKFGAFKEIRVAGVLNGRGFVLGGVSYLSKRVTHATPTGPRTFTRIDYAAFVHAGGSGTVLGFLSVSIDYHVGLYIQEGGGQSRMYGAVKVTYSFKIGFFKKKVSVRFEKTFRGSDSGGQRLTSGKVGASHMPREQWQLYRRAFAA